MFRAVRRFWDVLGYDADFWRGPVILGALLAGLTWLVWYFTKVPCTFDNAASGLCNPSIVASFINVDIVSRCTGAWLGATTLTGGINAIMLSRERERTEEANRRADEERKRADQRIETLMNELREERRQADERLDEERREAAERVAEERRQADERLDEERREAAERVAEERRLAAEERRILMATITELTGAITELRRENGSNKGSEN